MTLVICTFLGLCMLFGLRQGLITLDCDEAGLKKLIADAVDARAAGQVAAVDELQKQIRQMHREALRDGSGSERAPAGLVSERTARGLGLLSLSLGNHPSSGKARELYQNEFATRALAEGTIGSGAELVPDEFAREIIRLVETYGVIDRNARIMGLKAASLQVPMRTGGLTVYAPGEAGTITPSSPAFGSVTLTPTKLATLTAISSELEEDSVISVGELVADEIALAFALSHDSQAFIGDGSATYFGRTGIVNALTGIANNKSVVAASGNAWSEVTRKDLLTMVGTCSTRARFRAKWYMNPLFYYGCAMELAYAAGGATATEVVAGVINGQPRLFGYPVEFVEVLPNAEANSSVPAVFGDLRGGVMVGKRRELGIVRSTEVYFATDQIGIRATERWTAVTVDTGSAAAAGGIVALQMAAN